MWARAGVALEVVSTPADVTDAGEDGDFFALRESREARIPEELDLSSLNDDLSKITEHEGDCNNLLVSRPTSSRFRKLTAVVGDPWLRWTELTDAAMSGSDTFKEALLKATSKAALSSNLLQNPLNRQNILHFVLELGDSEVTNSVVKMADQDLIESNFDVDIMKITGKKTPLHQVVEKNNLPLLKLLLNKIGSRTKKIELLNVETPIEIKGQRPRTFPCLHLAAYYGFIEIVDYIITEGVDVNHLNAKKDTALLWATRFGHIETVQSLLFRGALPDLENDKGSTALYWAVRYGHPDVVEVLAAEGKADVGKQRQLGFVAPIVLASALGLTKTLSILLKYGADPNTTIRGGERPIHHAAKEGFSDIIELLISHGAKVDAADDRGDRAVLLAAKYGSAKALHTLLKHGANLDCTNQLGENVWKAAINCSNDVILKLLVGHQRRVEDEGALEESPKSASPAADGANSLLFLAAAAGNTSKMKLLFKMKVDSSVTDRNGNTFIHTAAIYNQDYVIEKFHNMANIDAANSDGNTALHEACSRGNCEAITTLIKLKAMANIRNGKGETALHLTAYCRSIQAGTVSILMDFVKKTHSWDCLNMKDNKRNNALHIAAKHAQPDVLWEFRFVSLKDTDNDENTALHCAIRSGAPDVLDTMLNILDETKRDCDINHRNKNGETPLFLAAREGLLHGVKRLMFFGADISAPGPEGNTVLHMLTSLTVTSPAQCSRFLDIIVAVLEKAPTWYITKNDLTQSVVEKEHLVVRRRSILKLVTDIPNAGGLTVLDLACKVGASDVVKLLVTMENVMRFKQSGDSTRYDMTHLIPSTNGSVSVSLSCRKVTPRLSCLEWILASGRDVPHNAAKVLDIQPFQHIEAAYGTVSNLTYAGMLILHVFYMGMLSWTGLTVLNKYRLPPGERHVQGESMVIYIIISIEPLIIMIYNMYSVYRFCCSREMSIKNRMTHNYNTVKRGFAIFITYVYAFFVAAWIVTYAVNYSAADIFLSIALCMGWMLSIAITRGFKFISHFWMLIQILIIRDVFKFLFIYLFVLLAFSFAFHALFQVSQDVVNQYPNPLYTIYLMFNMMIGMQYVFDDGVVSSGFMAEGRSDAFIKVLYVLYMILATIILLNILIAMMNDSYKEILERQKLAWRIECIALGVEVEQRASFTFNLLSKVKIIYGHICPSDEIYNVKRWYIDVNNKEGGSCVESSRTVLESDQQVISELKSKVSTMEANFSAQLHSIKSSIDEIQSLLKSFEETLATTAKD